MKIILLHPDIELRHHLRLLLERHGHTLVAESAETGWILALAAKHRPHLILAEKSSDPSQDKIRQILQRYQMELDLVWLPSEPRTWNWSVWVDEMLAARSDPPQLSTLKHYSDTKRNVIRDDAYLPFESSSKHNLPDELEKGTDRFNEELAIFARQVEQAVKIHPVATHYLKQVLITDRGLRVETGYRAVHSSHKIYWLREHLFRWVGVLAHYLPGVDPLYLPPPAPPSPHLDFLHYTPPAESFYAAMALLAHGFKPSWTASLRANLGKKFTGQDEASLLEETLILTGWSNLLREVALAHSRVMSCALDNQFPDYQKNLPTRKLHRSVGIYCDFWHLRCLRLNPELLNAIAHDVVKEGIKAPPILPLVPAFRDFLAALGTSQTDENQSRKQRNL